MAEVDGPYDDGKGAQGSKYFLLAEVDAEGFHFAVEVGAFEAQGFGGARDVAVGAVEFFQDVVALVGFAGGLEGGELFAAGA